MSLSATKNLTTPFSTNPFKSELSRKSIHNSNTMLNSIQTYRKLSFTKEKFDIDVSFNARCDWLQLFTITILSADQGFLEYSSFCANN